MLGGHDSAGGTGASADYRRCDQRAVTQVTALTQGRGGGEGRGELPSRVAGARHGGRMKDTPVRLRETVRRAGI